MKKNALTESNVEKIAKGWATNYADKIDEKAREHLANLADDIAYAVYKFAVDTNAELMKDLKEGHIGPANAKAEFSKRMKEFYERITDGTEIG